MVHDAFPLRCPHVLSFPPELLAYQRWLGAERAKPRERDYLFTQALPRFEPRREDVVVPLPDLRVETSKGRCQLHSPKQQASIELPGIQGRDAQRMVASLDGTRCLVESQWASGVERATFAKFMRLTFGLVTFAPQAVADIENAIPGTEITRFPGAAYAIERPYWNNMADVRRYAQSVGDLLDSARTFELRLREMHVLALMGRSLGSFYKPASPVSDEVVAPGALFLDAVRLHSGVEGTVFLDGPRANVSLVGGDGFHRLVYASVGDDAAMAPERSFAIDGLPWGSYVFARSERDEQPGAWFCPPRPITEGHFEWMLAALRAAHEAARNGNVDETVRCAANFHQAFVRLHPFHCANQCIAMNLANAVLRQACGSGIPHLTLDHFALRMSWSAYERLFARAVRAFSCDAHDPATRLATLVVKKNRAFAMIHRLGKTKTLPEAEAVMREDRDAAGLALVVG